MCVPECQNGGDCSQPNTCDCSGTEYMGDLCQTRMLLTSFLAFVPLTVVTKHNL